MVIREHTERVSNICTDMIAGLSPQKNFDFCREVGVLDNIPLKFGGTAVVEGAVSSVKRIPASLRVHFRVRGANPPKNQQSGPHEFRSASE